MAGQQSGTSEENVRHAASAKEEILAAHMLLDMLGVPRQDNNGLAWVAARIKMLAERKGRQHETG